MSTHVFDRRSVLRAACTAGLVGAAGCTGSGTDGSGDGGDPCESDGGEGGGGDDGGGSDLCTSPDSDLSLGRLGLSLGEMGPGLDSRPTTRRMTQQVGVPLKSVDVELHRRAVEVIERLRGTDVAPEWTDATLREPVFPFYRPDLEAPAYYEFEVEPVGSVVLSTGRHDFPVVHVNPKGRSVSERLFRLAEKAEIGIDQLYRLDTLAFVAEGSEGERIVTLGRLIAKPVGVRPEWFEPGRPINTTRIRPSGVSTDQQGDTDTAYRVEHSGPEVPRITHERWESWGELKENYEEVYRVQLEALRRAAAEDWEVYDLIAESGRGIAEQYDLPLLYRDTEADLRGQGAELVTAERVDRDQGPPVLRITPKQAVGSRVHFTVRVTYPDGSERDLRFFLVPTSGRLAPPAKGASSLGGAPTVQSGGGGSTVWEAASPADLPAYHHDFERDGCVVGPGAAAWAMLFGWADNQAAGTSGYWSPLWGLYRKHAGKRPNGDDDAPMGMTGCAKKMIHELHKRTGECSNGNTINSLMFDVRSYIKDRTGKAEVVADLESGHHPAIREKVKNSITAPAPESAPVVVGTGIDSHGYVLAWQYTEQEVTTTSGKVEFERKFGVRVGSEDLPTCTIDGLIPARAFFAGRISPSDGSSSELRR